MGGCPDTLVTPLDPPLDCLYIYTVLWLNLAHIVRIVIFGK